MQLNETIKVRSILFRVALNYRLKILNKSYKVYSKDLPISAVVALFIEISNLRIFLSWIPPQTTSEYA